MKYKFFEIFPLFISHLIGALKGDPEALRRGLCKIPVPVLK
jgi:hypothetical protein